MQNGNNNRSKLATHAEKINNIVEDVGEIKLMLIRMFEPNGVCDKRHAVSEENEKEIDVLKREVKTKFGVLLTISMIILAAAIKAAFF